VHRLRRNRPFIHTLVEDERHPGLRRADAWHYLDDAIAQAEQRGIYVILDLHGAAGGQAGEKEQHDGCTGPAALWTTPAYQDRTVWLWQQVAARYRDRPAVAGYSRYCPQCECPTTTTRRPN
jgi:glucan 1,3-beta-glucosidase